MAAPTTTGATDSDGPPAEPAPPAPAAAKRPNAARRMLGSAAALREQRERMIQLALFAAGAVLMPFGLLAIGLGWYGTAHSRYDYDQRTYLISGGIMGLGIAFVGGFLYFGAWLAKMANDQRESSRQLAESLNLLTGYLAQQQTGHGRNGSTDGSELVLAGDGHTIHRRDCPLISARSDLRPLTGTETNLITCRVCRPAAD